jgi:hypothetical protein
MGLQGEFPFWVSPSPRSIRLTGTECNCNDSGDGVIWDWTPSKAPVIPAKAGIQFADFTRRAEWIPAPRLRGDKLRGNDRGLERPCFSNDTSTMIRFVLLCQRVVAMMS